MENTYNILVVGENPDNLLSKYNKNLHYEPYIKFAKNNASQLKKEKIQILERIQQNSSNLHLSPIQLDLLNVSLSELKKMSDEDYFMSFTADYKHDNEGNAISTDNPNGKWSSYTVGKDFSYPFKLKNGNLVFQCHVNDVNWSTMHLANTDIYDKAWDIIHQKITPTSKLEQTIFSNFDVLKEQISHFSSKEEYIKYNCSYYTYAYLDSNGWVDIEDCSNQYNWITTFYERFILPLQNNEIISIYEYKK